MTHSARAQSGNSGPIDCSVDSRDSAEGRGSGRARTPSGTSPGTFGIASRSAKSMTADLQQGERRSCCQPTIRTSATLRIRTTVPVPGKAGRAGSGLRPLELIRIGSSSSTTPVADRQPRTAARNGRCQCWLDLRSRSPSRFGSCQGTRPSGPDSYRTSHRGGRYRAGSAVARRVSAGHVPDYLLEHEPADS